MKIMKNLAIIATITVALFSTTAAAGINWNVNKNVSCVTGSYGSNGVTIIREEVLQFVAQSVADSGADVSACDGIIPSSVDPKRISEVGPWLASIGYSNADFRANGQCELYSDNDPDAGSFTSCHVDDGVAGTVGAAVDETFRAHRADTGWN